MEKLHHVKRHKCEISCTRVWMLENTSYTWNFQFVASTSAVNSSWSPLLSFVCGIKVVPSHKSQILYDKLEIALSKMQSAKAASSADELPCLRRRQWYVSFAPTGSTENKTSVNHNADLHPPNGSTSVQVKSPQTSKGCTELIWGTSVLCSNKKKYLWYIFFHKHLPWYWRASHDCFLVEK